MTESTQQQEQRTTAYSKEDEELALRYTMQIFSGRITQRTEFEEGFSVLDAQSHAAQFKNDLDILRSIKRRVPAFRVRENLLFPVSLSLLAFGPRPQIGEPFGGAPRPYLRRVIRRYLSDYLYDLQRDDYGGLGQIIEISAKEARKHFLVGMSRFLATRLAAVRRWAGRDDDREAAAPSGGVLTIAQHVGGAPASVPGCSFSVSSNTSNLSVYWSGAYYISSNYFGHPTSPATATLQSGTYVFGVNGGAYGNTIQWDTQAVCSLPGASSVHLNY